MLLIKSFEMALNSRHRTEKLNIKDTEIRKTKTEKDENLVLHGAFRIFKSSHYRCSMKKGVLKNFTKFTGKHLCLSLFFNKVVGFRHISLQRNHH